MFYSILAISRPGIKYIKYEVYKAYKESKHIPFIYIHILLYIKSYICNSYNVLYTPLTGLIIVSENLVYI